MLAKFSSRLELFFLDIFIYVLSDSKWFRMIVRGFYAMMNDRQLFQQFVLVCLVFGLFGLSMGWVMFTLLDSSVSILPF